MSLAPFSQASTGSFTNHLTESHTRAHYVCRNVCQPRQVGTCTVPCCIQLHGKPKSRRISFLDLTMRQCRLAWSKHKLANKSASRAGPTDRQTDCVSNARHDDGRRRHECEPVHSMAPHSSALAVARTLMPVAVAGGGAFVLL